MRHFRRAYFMKMPTAIERGRRAAEKRDELTAAAHSITSSAMASSDGGTVRPSVRAV
jgi:hypothetical protein